MWFLPGFYFMAISKVYVTRDIDPFAFENEYTTYILMRHWQRTARDRILCRIFVQPKKFKTDYW